MNVFDIIVIGGGHAGVEASLAAARLNKRTLMLCQDFGTVANMPCNPAIGGTAKGHLVKEIDALGGQMGLSADMALLQVKTLNSAKGPAVFSLRGQEDKARYHEIMLDAVMHADNLTVLAKEAARVLTSDGAVSGVATDDGEEYYSKAVVLATGVYLNSTIITGESVVESGPSGFSSARKLTDSLLELGLPIRRFKTGTPARIYRDSIDFDKMQIQLGDDSDRFSFMSPHATFKEEPCWLTYTNARTHEVILKNLERSPLYNGTIRGVGPRYCPSIETKVVRFKDKDRHQIFIEPEGQDSEEMYVQGMSTSLPADVQEEMYRTIEGLEHCRFAKYGYAIEYDCLDPLSLYPTLECKAVKGLYSAGQMNGSSGYEEAAAQGLIAGINAARAIDGKAPIVLGRDEAYIGVLIDDLVTKGTNEPYRMMTARAEHRIMLRQDNADMRLTELGYEIGLASEARYERLQIKKAQMAKIFAVKDRAVDRGRASVLFDRIGEPLPQKTPTLGEICRRPSISAEDVAPLLDFEIDREALRAAVIELKYEGYLKKETSAVNEQKRLEGKRIPDGFDYDSIKALRIEARQKLSEIRPLNLGQASRISGVSPADIAVLIVALQKFQAQK
ncbi:MAG: tRNA uridine-5-carboxymethylaminomethyl(34) synthesis enzyme MnmG [Bacteroides sp.]|nr:tRNA uridine-5-carboxymethylaminomethyl(34) synthesis enzyme MnmG [Bacillota bacterium]MCM1456153.1 tRNA uridine-5-carboxymethylaminomethyl(34) synthesis enzyme MnmG [Bacteroides sp.]